MQFDWWTLGLQALNALVLLWILARFFFRPVADMIAERQKAAGAVLADAEKVKAEAERARKEAEDEATRLAAERSDLVAAAAKEAEAARAAMIKSAEAEAEKIRAEARAAAEGLKAEQLRQASADAARLTVDLTGRLLSRLPDSARIAGFIAGLGRSVAELPEASRASIGERGQPVRLRAARDLTDEERAAVASALGEALGRPVGLETVADPSLLAGLELETPHALVRNSFKADLEQIEAKMADHD